MVAGRSDRDTLVEEKEEEVEEEDYEEEEEEEKKEKEKWRGWLWEEVTGIHWRIDGGRSHHYYHRNHQSDQTTANERPQHSSTQVDENIIPDKNIILSLSDKFHHNVIGFIGKNEM